MGYIIALQAGYGSFDNYVYYAGGNYIVAGEKYAVIVESWKKAKVYTTQARAENALNKLVNSGCQNVTRGKVIELEGTDVRWN